MRAGKISYVGLSNYTGWQVQKVVDLAEFRGLARPVTLQPQYNLLVREIEWEIVPACESTELGLLPWSPLGGGWLTGKYTRDARPTGATRLGEDPERGVEAYDRRSTKQRTWDVDRRGPVGRLVARSHHGAGRARVGGRPADGDLGDPRRPHRSSSYRTTSAPRACT